MTKARATGKLREEATGQPMAMAITVKIRNHSASSSKKIGRQVLLWQ